MVRLTRSKLAQSVDSSSDDVKLDRNLKKNTGRGLRTVGLYYFMKESCGRDSRDMEDSMKGLEHGSDVDFEYLEYLNSDHMSVRKNRDKKVVNDDSTNNDPQFDMFLSCLKPRGTACMLEVSETNGLSMPIFYGLDESDEFLNREIEGRSKDIVIEPKTATKNMVLRSFDNHQTSLKDCSVNSEESDSLCRVGIQSNEGKVEEDDGSVYIDNSDGDIDSDFRKDVIKILRKPYNHVEHKKLLDMISARKPIDRHIDLRHGRTGFYAGLKDGKSYLDQFSVVRQKLDAAKDACENLNLLRGFFFWLQNLTRENSFLPWKDEACLAVLPQAAVGKRKREI